MQGVRLTEEMLAKPEARELVTLLEEMLRDGVITLHEISSLISVIQRSLNQGADLPALKHLDSVLQDIIADGVVEPFETAMLYAVIEDVLPLRRVELIPSSSSVELRSPTPLERAPRGRPRKEKAPKPTPTQAVDGDGRQVPRPNGDSVDWVIVDTETSGLFAPIYAVEIAAQRMRGWIPHGEPFRILLNHDVELEPAAVATHGYTRKFLREHGVDPMEAHSMFSDYAGGLSMVAHNLAYDFNRVLEPEWSRLRISPICSAGFCTVMLSRRCLPEIESAALGSLAGKFRLGEVSHHAGDDVRLTVRLYSEVLAPRLEQAGIKTFGEVKALSRKTPLATCRSMFQGAPSSVPPRTIKPSSKARKFTTFLRGLTANRPLTNLECTALQEWLQAEGCHSPEALRAQELVEKIMADGQVTTDELAMLAGELQKMVAA